MKIRKRKNAHGKLSSELKEPVNDMTALVCKCLVILKCIFQIEVEFVAFFKTNVSDYFFSLIFSTLYFLFNLSLAVSIFLNLKNIYIYFPKQLLKSSFIVF